MALSPELREARRRNVIDAAHMLVRETGGTGFSMAQLAQRAGMGAQLNRMTTPPHG